MTPTAEPFTVPHFRQWAKRLILDSFEPWVLEPFQEAFLEDVFAGTPVCWLIVPECNGKTTLAAGLALYHIEHTEEGNVPVAASTRQQAEILFRQAAGFCMRSPALAVGETFLPQEGTRRIRCDRSRSRIQIIAADAGTGDGSIHTLAIIDELHRHKSLDLYDMFCGKWDKRKGQVVVISTAGEPGSPFEERRTQIRQKAENVERDGSFLRASSERLVVHEWALQEGEDPEDLEAVARANPFSGITVESLRGKASAPDFAIGHWTRFTCNLPTRGDFAAIQEKEWWSAQTDEEIPPGEPVVCGLDLGFKMDTTAIAPLWIGPDFRLLGPARVLEPPRDNTTLDVHEIERVFAEIHARNPIEKVCMDPHEGRDVAEWLEDELGCLVVEMSQRIPQKVKNYNRFMEGLRQGTLKHSGDPGLTQHALNAVVRILPGGDLCFARPVKHSIANKSLQDRRVIDALDAASMVNADAVEMLEPAGDLVLL